jgi:hypothetical protein
MKINLTKDRITEIFLFVFLIVCFTYFFPRWADPNQNSRLDTIVAVVDDGTFQIDKYVENTVDYAIVGDHYYSDKAPGTALLGIPIYAGLHIILDHPIIQGLMQKLENNDAFRATLRQDGSGILEQKVRFAIAQIVLTFFVSTLPSAILGVLLFRFTSLFTADIGKRLSLVLGYALFTPAFAYAGAYYGHQLSAALLFGAFYLVASEVKDRSALAPLSVSKSLSIGLLLGVSVLTEYPSALVVGILYLYTLYHLYRQGRWQRIGWVTLAGSVIAVVLMAYNTAIFGSPFKLGYSDSTLWQTQHDTGFMSLTMPHWDAMWGITFGIFRGLFVLSPLLLLAIPGFYLWWQSRRFRGEFWVALSSILAMFLFNSSSIMWWGGFAIGPRYILPMLPFLAFPIIFVFLRWEKRIWFKILAVILYGWSLFATWGLTLAEQAFPPDTIYNPFLGYALPNWRIGNIARNLGTVLGFRGLWSLIPLFVILVMVAGIWWWVMHHDTKLFVHQKNPPVFNWNR